MLFSDGNRLGLHQTQKTVHHVNVNSINNNHSTLFQLKFYLVAWLNSLFIHY